ncbi:MAG: efflux RND transporter periplasmic adaptor subunit [Bacteroidota bacterium]
MKLGATGIVLALLAGGYYFLGSALDPAIEVQLTMVSLSSPSQANAVLTASGYVVAQRKAAVASKATGRLEYLGVVEGDKVKKGQILARIESADMKAGLDQATANLGLSEAELLDAQRSLERQNALLEKGLTTQAERDGADARYKRVLASIELANASINAAEVALENTLIRAPFDGTVLSKNADVGEMVAPMAASVSSRSAVVTIADMTSLEVEADVSESNIERIKAAQPCEITLDAYPGSRYRGFVSKIVPTADRAKATVLVKVGFESYDGRVLPEMSAKVLFLTKQTDAAEQDAKPMLTVSASAIASRNGRKVAFFVRENKAVEVSVTTGKDMGGLVEITNGLAAGDRVIGKLDDTIRDGIKVKVK